MVRSSIQIFIVLLLGFPLVSQGEWVPFHEASYRVQEVRLKEVRELAIQEKYKNWKFKEVMAAGNPQMDKVLIIRDHLVPIIEAYVADPTVPGSYTENKNNLEFLKKIFYSGHEGMGSIISEYNVVFEFAEDRMRVVGVEPTRLAVNSGHDITFNANALATNKYSVADLVQIWLHEIFHGDTTTPLQIKDEWAAKVALWVQSKTQVIDLSDGSKVTLLKLPAPETTDLKPGFSKLAKGIEQRYKTLSFEEQFQEELRSRFLIFKEDEKKTELVTEVYKAAKTYGDFLRSEFPTWDPYSKLSWPQVQVTEIRKKVDGSIRLEYHQKSLPLQATQGGGYHKDTQYATTEPDLPQNRYRIDFNPETATTDIQRTYSVPLQDGDFEVQRIQDVRQKRYVSVRLNIPDSLKVLKSGTSVHLIAKDLQTKNNLSAVLLSQRVLNNEEVLLQFELPQRNIEISQILIPTQNKDGMYHELALRPSKIQLLNGHGPLESPNLKIQSFTIQEREKKTDPLRAHLKTQSQKRITGVTLEMEHTVQAIRTQWNGFQQMHDDLGSYGVGKKYYLDKKSLSAKKTAEGVDLTLLLPEENISQFRQGPRIRKMITEAYNFQKTLQAETLRDQGSRQITNAWIHFEDGTNEKIPFEKIPPAFSFISQEETNEAEREIQEYVRKRRAARFSAKQCKDVFSP